MTDQPARSTDDMRLPSGMTCRHCAHFLRCVALFGCEATNIECDWAPSRFTEKRPSNV